jgi:hypothetical protein
MQVFQQFAAPQINFKKSGMMEVQFYLLAWVTCGIFSIGISANNLLAAQVNLVSKCFGETEIYIKINNEYEFPNKMTISFSSLIILFISL